jgi:5'-nucleotidase
METLKKKDLLLDMDGPVVDLLPTWLYEYELRSFEHVPVEAIKKYHHEQYVTDHVTFWESLQPALARARPTPGALFSVNVLMHYYNVYFVSYCHPAAPEAMSLKRLWVEKHLPEFDLDNMIFTKKKHLVMGDVLIEDSEEMLKDWKWTNPEGRGLLFKTGYTPEGKAWTDIIDLLTRKEIYNGPQG